MGLYILSGHWLSFYQLLYISVPEDCFYLNKQCRFCSDEMAHYAAFHLGLHCLSKYPFRGFQNTKGGRYISNIYFLYFNNVLNLMAESCCLFVIE